MRIFDPFRRKPAPVVVPNHPYTNEKTDRLYHLFFGDNSAMYRNHSGSYDTEGTVMAKQTSVAGLQMVMEGNYDVRYRLLAANRLLSEGYKVDPPLLFGVIVELHRESGLEVLAAYADGSARYINGNGNVWVLDQNPALAGKPGNGSSHPGYGMDVFAAFGGKEVSELVRDNTISAWKTPDINTNELTEDLISNAHALGKRLIARKGDRLKFPDETMGRITVLMSDGPHMDQDPLEWLPEPLHRSSPVLRSALRLIEQLTAQNI